MPKRKCNFSDAFTKEWSFIRKGRNQYEAYCSMCNMYISVSHSGKAAITDHIKSKNHQAKKSIASTSQDISSFMVKQNTPEDVLVCAAELTTVYKIINHHQSFNSLDCGTKLNGILYPDSKIALKQSTARTKATSILKNILAPHTVAQIKEELKNIPFFGILTDASNHGSEKLFPLLVQYFSQSEGLKVKLIKISSLENETSETITNYCVNTLNNLVIPLEKLTAFSADNTNTNFGGRERRGTNNVYYKLQKELSKNIEGVGCPAHILHNTASSAADVLSVDVESVVLKIYKYFSIYTVRNERLKSFCDEADVTYSSIQSHSRTRWLSLLPALEKILKLWEPLKQFFLNETKPPKVLVDFFNHPLSEIYFLFLHCQSFLFEKQIKRLEKHFITITEVNGLIQDLQVTLLQRSEAMFLGIQTKRQYNLLKKNDYNLEKLKVFDGEIKEYYKTAIDYLKQWSEPLSKYDVFSWMLLHDIPQWEMVEKSISYLQDKGINIEDNIFDEILYLQNYVKEHANNDTWKEKNMNDKWLCFFKETDITERKKNLLLTCQYLFSIPGHNANVERVFSLVVSQWTKERNRLCIDTVESILLCKYNFNLSCADFYTYVKGQPHLLQQVKTSEKYDWFKKK